MASVGDFLFSLYKPIMSVGNFLSGGALSRIEERQHAQLLAQQQLTATKLQEQLAKQARDQTYNQSLRQAAIDSTQLDIAAEKGRLSKELEKITQEVAKIDAKLGNADFMARAPEEIVEEQHERRSDFTERSSKLTEALSRLM